MAIPQQRLPEFEKLRQQATQRVQSEGQQQQDALQRRLASIGNLKSGAALKQQQILQSELGKQREGAIGQIDVQEAGEMQRRQEVQDTRDFAQKEAQAGRQFAAQEALAGREFAGRESALGRTQQAEQFGKTFGSQEEQNRFMNRLAREEFDFNKAATLGNQAAAIAQLKPEQRRSYLDYWFALDPTAAKPAIEQSQAMQRRQPDMSWAFGRRGPTIGGQSIGGF